MPWIYSTEGDINTCLKHGIYSFRITEELNNLGISGSIGFVIVLSTGSYSDSPFGIQLAFGYYGTVILFRQFTSYGSTKFEKWKKIILQ